MGRKAERVGRGRKWGRAEQKIQLMLTFNWEERAENIPKTQARREGPEWDRGATEKVQAKAYPGGHSVGRNTKTGTDSFGRDTNQGPKS